MYPNQSVSLWLRAALVVVFVASCVPLKAREVQTDTALPATTAPVSEQNQIRKRISLPRGAWAVAFGDGSIWVTNRAEHNVSRIDMNTGESVGLPIPMGFEPREIAFGEGAVWVCSADHTRLARIDPQNGKMIAEIDLRPLEIPDHVLLLITAGEGAVWITDQTHIIQIDP